MSNPPYVAEHEVPDLPRAVVDWEPRLALVSGPTGLEAIEAIVAEAPHWLEPAGALVVELAPAPGGVGRARSRRLRASPSSPFAPTSRVATVCSWPG